MTLNSARKEIMCNTNLFVRNLDIAEFSFIIYTIFKKK